jgi:heptose-I-phosphate ethanolaminephosphotransferase
LKFFKPIFFTSIAAPYLAVDLLHSVSVVPDGLVVYSFILSFLYTMDSFGSISNYNKLKLLVQSLVSSLIFVQGSIILCYSLRFGAISSHDLYSVFQTDFKEVMEFLQQTYLLYILFPVLVLSTLYMAAGYWYLQKYYLSITPHLLFRLLPLGVFILSLFFYVWIGKDTPFWKENGDFFHRFRSAYKAYVKDLNTVVRINANQKLDVVIEDKSPRLHIVVIGESASKDHFSSYGYFIKTTPFLEGIQQNPNSIFFEQAYSEYLNTYPSLKGILLKEQEGLINILNKGGVATYWLSNQTDKGFYDIPVARLAKVSQSAFFLNRNKPDDFSSEKDVDVLLPAFKKILNRVEGNKSTVIFIHTMGSHGFYCNRGGEDKFAQDYTEIEKKINFFFGSEKVSLRSLQCYDGSIYETDRLLQEIYTLLKDRSDFGSLTYFSDHGEDVWQQTGHNHSAPYHRKARIPYFSIFSDLYLNENPRIREALQENKGKIVSNTMLFHYFQSLVGVKSKKTYDPQFDISSSKYSPSKNELVILDSTYMEKDPLLLAHQRAQANEKIWVHRVNSIGKMMDANAADANGIEVDVFYKNKEIVIGHGKENYNKGTLKEYLHYAAVFGYKNLWLDFKNIKEANVMDIYLAFGELAKSYPWLKEKVLLETSYEGNKLAIFVKSGYKVSYYLPTQKIKEAIVKNDKKHLEKLAKSVLANVHTNQLKIVSFDVELYPFVKSYLEKEDNRLFYYTWDHTDRLSNKEERLLLQDEKVKVVLKPFLYRFNW